MSGTLRNGEGRQSLAWWNSRIKIGQSFYFVDTMLRYLRKSYHLMLKTSALMGYWFPFTDVEMRVGKAETSLWPQS